MVSSNERNQREGLLLCMMLTTLADGVVQHEETAEIARVASEEPEFQHVSEEEFDSLLARVTGDLQEYPDAVMTRIAALLPTSALRRRGLELATRVVVADGLVQSSHARLLEELAARLDIARSELRAIIAAAHRRLARYMIVYLIYLTAFSDGMLGAEEFEEMVPYALNFPVFQGVGADEFRSIMVSVRSNLGEMRGEDGVDYICGTLLKAAELLDDETLPDQALKLVARGIMADGKAEASEREFFRTLANRLGRPHLAEAR